MAIMRKLKLATSAMSPPRYTKLTGDDFEGQVRKGYVPVMVGSDGVSERFLVPTNFLSHPVIASLLDSSADEFGYRQDGVLQILVEPDCFREIVRRLK